MVIKIRAHAFKRIKDLGEAVVRDIDQRLLSGSSTLEEIATYIQEELKLSRDITFQSMVKTLGRYRATELKSKVLNRVVASHVSRNGEKGTDTAVLHKRLNALDELEELVGIQKNRFHKMYMKESAGPILMKSVTSEANLLRTMLLDLGKLQLETGVMARAPKRIQGTLTDDEGKVTSFVWSEEQDALFKELQGVALEDEG